MPGALRCTLVIQASEVGTQITLAALETGKLRLPRD